MIERIEQDHQLLHLASRIRGYARYLAAERSSENGMGDAAIRYGTYHIPDSFAPKHYPYVRAVVNSGYDESNVLIDNLFSLTLLQTPDVDEISDNEYELIAWREGYEDHPDRPTIGEVMWNSPRYEFNSLRNEPGLARLALSMLDGFDRFIPQLIPQPSTKRGIGQRYLETHQQWFDGSHLV
jgi:hypothetical protein